MAFFGRGKNKAVNPYGLLDMYAEYAEEYTGHPSYDVSKETFVQLCEEFYKRMMHSILYKGQEFALPYRLGLVKVYKNKINYEHPLAVDWQTTLKTGKKVYHLNDHTRGYKYFFRWNKHGVVMKYKSIYRLVMTRTHKRDLARLIKEGQDYYELRK